MKLLFAVGLALLVFTAETQAGEAMKQVIRIVEASLPKEWQHFKGANRIWIVKSNVKVIDSYFGIVNNQWEITEPIDFMIEIRFTPKVSEKEYQSLEDLRSQIIKQRIENDKLRNLPKKAEASISTDMVRSIQMPDYHTQTESIWITSTPHGPTRPLEAMEVMKEIRMKLKNQFKSYVQR